jgi:hypothetical protein
MVQKIILAEKLYSYNPNFNFMPLIHKYIQKLSKEINELEVSLDIENFRTQENRLEIKIEGEDEEFVKNLLKQKIGSIERFNNINKGEILKGYLVDAKKVGFGIFIDCGIRYPTTDVLINLYTLRNQLCHGKKIPLRKILDLFGFIENFPIYVKIEEISQSKKKIRGIIAENTLEIINNWFLDKLERVFVSGSTGSQVKKAIVKMGHSQDVITIKKLGFLEHIIILKKRTNAPGIIAHIGKRLQYSKLSAIRPLKMSDFR